MIEYKHDRRNNPITSFLIQPRFQGEQTTVPIERGEYKKAKQAQSTALLTLKFESSADKFFRSYEELEATCLEISVHESIRRNHNRDFMESYDTRSTVERRISTTLSYARGYLDKSASNIRKLAGRDALKIFKAYRKREYDKHFSYRLMEELRNYAQHSGDSMSGVTHYNSVETLHADRQDQRDHRLVAVTRPQISVERIQSASRFKPSVARESADFCGKDGGIDLLLHLRRYASCIGAIHEDIRLQVAEICNGAERYQRSVREKYESASGVASDYLACYAVDEKGVVGGSVSLHPFAFKTIKRLVARNAGLTDIEKMIVSTELPKHNRT